MNFSLWNLLAVIVSAAVGAMGLGGGSVLILYLTLILNMQQVQAQGINLLFFLPCAITAVVVYKKRNLLNKQYLLPLIFGGFVGVGGGMVLLQFLDTRYIRWIFAVFLLTLGIITFFQKNKLYCSAKKNMLKY